MKLLIIKEVLRTFIVYVEIEEQWKTQEGWQILKLNSYKVNQHTG